MWRAVKGKQVPQETNGDPIMKSVLSFWLPQRIIPLSSVGFLGHLFFYALGTRLIGIIYWISVWRLPAVRAVFQGLKASNQNLKAKVLISVIISQIVRLQKPALQNLGFLEHIFLISLSLVSSLSSLITGLTLSS